MENSPSFYCFYFLTKREKSEHHLARCLPSSICLGRLSPTCSSRGADLKSKIFFFGISSILPRDRGDCAPLPGSRDAMVAVCRLLHKLKRFLPC